MDTLFSIIVAHIQIKFKLYKYIGSGLLFEKVKSALVWILLILNTMLNSLDFTNSKDCIYTYGLY